MGKGKERFVLIDALRGIAAIAVVFHHLPAWRTPMQSAVLTRWPHLVLSALHLGECGVQIFFVISGFVIAHSLASITPGWRTTINFAFRRQVRLDPPYWCAVGVALLAPLAFPAALSYRAPHPLEQLPINLFYLQGVFPQPAILGVSWTLCLEIQFYVTLILILWLSYGLHLPRIAAPLLVLAVSATSLIHVQPPICPWFPANWPYFAGGALAYWTWRRKCPRWLLALDLLILGALGRFGLAQVVVGIATIVGIWACAEKNRLTVWTFGRPAQYLGKISYSLYLLHSLVIVAVLHVGYRISGDRVWSVLFWWGVTVLASIGAANLLWRFVESPSMRFASRIKRGKHEALPTSVPVPAAGLVAAQARVT